MMSTTQKTGPQSPSKEGAKIRGGKTQLIPPLFRVNAHSSPPVASTSSTGVESKLKKLSIESGARGNSCQSEDTPSGKNQTSATPKSASNPPTSKPSSKPPTKTPSKLQSPRPVPDPSKPPSQKPVSGPPKPPPEPSSLQEEKRPNHATRRRALHILERLNSSDINTWSEKDNVDFLWATEVQDKDKRFSTTTTDIRPLSAKGDVSTTAFAAKRLRSQDSVPSSEHKKAKRATSPVRSFSDVAKDSLTVAVIDHGEDDGQITTEKWLEIESRLITALLDHNAQNPDLPLPLYMDQGWQSGSVKLIACANQMSLDFIKAAISGLGEVWPGAQLEVVSRANIPRRPRARAWIPLVPSDPAKILHLLKNQNLAIPTSNWKVAKLEEPKDGKREVMLLLNKESLPILKECNYMVHYAFNRILLRVYGQDEKALSADQAPVTANEIAPANLDPADEPVMYSGAVGSSGQEKGDCSDVICHSDKPASL